MKLKSIIFYLAGALAFTGISCQQSGTKNVKLETVIDSASYAVGMQMGENIKQNLKEIPGGDSMNVDAIAAAFIASVKGEDLMISMEDGELVIRKYFQGQAEKEAQDNLEKGNAFLEENAKRDGVHTTESGLQYEVIQEGNGPKPKETDKVQVHYNGLFIDGTVFDSSVEKGEPVTFPVNGVIKGWTEGLQLMPAGSKYKFYIPSDLAYGERGSGNRIPPNTVLIFEVELLNIVK